MNNSETPTCQKVMFPVRLTPELYRAMMDRVQSEKKDERGYSVNQYLTELIEKDLKKKGK